MGGRDFDLFTIGAGSGGVRAARMAARFGARVAIAEERYLGGTCVNVGCVPKKLFVYASHFGDDFEDARGLRLDGGRAADLRLADARRQQGRARSSGSTGSTRRLLEDAGVRDHRGRAPIVDPHTVEVGRRRLQRREHPRRHRWLARHSADSGRRAGDHLQRGLLPRDAAPSAIVIVGGGYIAVEFAGIFARPRRRGDRSSTAGRSSCAASTKTCARISPRRCARRGIDLRFDTQRHARSRRAPAAGCARR